LGSLPGTLAQQGRTMGRSDNQLAPMMLPTRETVN